MPSECRVRVPATTANLGPGFDCLGLTLDLWNEAEFTLAGQGVEVSVEGEGAGRLPQDENNPIIAAARLVYQRAGQPLPGLRVRCKNCVPLGSGLGSSASAHLLGLLAGNFLLGQPFSRSEIHEMAVACEGHPDNVSAALFGGMVVAVRGEAGWLTRRYELPPLRAALVFPDFDFPTKAARAALPTQIPLRDAVYNLGRVVLVVDALRAGDLPLLAQVMSDRLHQPYRLPLVPGAAAAITAATQAGAAAAISGAGPSLIAFSTGDSAPVAAAMAAAFAAAGLPSRSYHLSVTNSGACVE